MGGLLEKRASIRSWGRGALWELKSTETGLIFFIPLNPILFLIWLVVCPGVPPVSPLINIFPGAPDLSVLKLACALTLTEETEKNEVPWLPPKPVSKMNQVNALHFQHLPPQELEAKSLKAILYPRL